MSRWYVLDFYGDIESQEEILGRLTGKAEV